MLARMGILLLTKRAFELILMISYRSLQTNPTLKAWAARFN